MNTPKKTDDYASQAIADTLGQLGLTAEQGLSADESATRLAQYGRNEMTVRVILFMTLSIVVFNFHPVTALMIILLALLNDLPMRSIAYDRTSVQKEPVR